MNTLLKTIQEAADILNAMDIKLTEITLPTKVHKELQKELSTEPSTHQDIEVEAGKTSVTKLSYNENLIKIK